MELNKCLIHIINDINHLKEIQLESVSIIDLRKWDRKSIIKSIEDISLILQNPDVVQIWINRFAESQFHEIKSRISKCFNKKNKVFNSFKLLQANENEDNQLVYLKGNKINLLINQLNNLTELSEYHPGISIRISKLVKTQIKLENSKKISFSELKKRKSEDSSLDSERPKKLSRKVYKLMESFSKSAVDENHNDFHKCNMCKTKTSKRICDSCQQLNNSMKSKCIDLKNRFALVTGSRIKIGYQISLRLLRNNCNVIATTRFPANALLRYKKESDFENWKNRLKICYLDLENLSSIEQFLNWCETNLPYLDILINNAAQTIQRPAEFYRSLENDENQMIEETSNEIVAVSKTITKNQLQLNSEQLENVFPLGKFDEFGQQLDLRSKNSWSYNSADVPLRELIQVLTINSIAPFLLVRDLKPLMTKSPFNRKFIVNVSAMEGQFNRVSKGHRHPHTNMAKAALNMMTRTTGLEYQSDGIFMTAVDTGWITDERPYNQAQYESKVSGFLPPLSCEDGAARVLHPIFHGLEEKNQPYFAVFLKDFHIHPW